MQFQRSSGILLHPTSLPGKFGIGSLGKEAYEFVDFLIETGQKLWQVFPLGPTGFSDSPYQCFSAFAGNPLLISLERLKDEGLLSEQDLSTDEKFDDDRVDYGKVINFKNPIYYKAFQNFKSRGHYEEKDRFYEFCDKHEKWLNDYSLFIALKENFGGKAWIEWERDIRLRKHVAVIRYEDELRDKIEFQKFLQYQFFKQWSDLRNYANKNKISIIGDVPIFVAFDSADAWSHPEIFFFDEERRPTKVAGVPPDYFSKTGQLWGNPLYNWEKLKEDGFKWWIERFKSAFELADIIRIDHFRGFAGYWAVPAGEETAINGKWEKALGMDLFKTVQKELGDLPILAEDLGVITPDVVELRDTFGFPGMKILQFGFDSREGSDYVPHCHIKNCVVYTGTHDNDTIVGWYEKADPNDKQYVNDYLNTDGKEIHWDFIRAAWASVAVIAIAPLQDILGLGSSARMNTPGVGEGNWQWRFRKEALTPEIRERLKKLTKVYRR